MIPMSSSTHLNATRKGNSKLLLILGAIVLVAQVIGPTSSLHAQKSNYLLATASRAIITIDGAEHHQIIDGFGISGAFGPANQLRTLSSTSDQKRILDLLFNTSTGAGFSILRNLLPSDGNHTIEPNNPGSPTATPHYVWDNSSWGQVWLAQEAQRYGVKQFYLDAWSSPGFMKTNGDEANGGSLCGSLGATCSSGDWRQAYANYLVQYIRDYKSDGIAITHIGFANEPNLKTSYSSMLINPAQAANFAKVLGPILRASPFHPQIVCCEEEGWNLAQSYTNAITSDPTSNVNVNVISSHGYTHAPDSALIGTGQKHIWQTEWSTFDPWNSSWDKGSNTSSFASPQPTGTATGTANGSDASGFTWAQHVYNGLTAANLSAFFYWWGFDLNENSTDNGALIHYKNNTVETSKRLWALANYSRFVRPKAIRIGAASNSSNLQVTAFKNTNGSIAIVVLNTSRSNTPITFSLQNTGITQAYIATPYITNASNNTAAQTQLSIQRQTFSATVPARSLVTYQVSPRPLR